MDRTPAYKPEPFFLAFSYIDWIELVGELIRNYFYDLALSIGWTVSRQMPANREPFDRSNLVPLKFNHPGDAELIRMIARDRLSDYAELRAEENGQGMKATAIDVRAVEFDVKCRHQIPASGEWTLWSSER